MALTAEQEVFIVRAAQCAAKLADGIYQIAQVRNQILTGNLPALSLLAQFK